MTLVYDSMLQKYMCGCYKELKLWETVRTDDCKQLMGKLDRVQIQKIQLLINSGFKICVAWLFNLFYVITDFSMQLFVILIHVYLVSFKGILVTDTKLVDTDYADVVRICQCVYI